METSFDLSRGTDGRRDVREAAWHGGSFGLLDVGSPRAAGAGSRSRQFAGAVAVGAAAFIVLAGVLAGAGGPLPAPVTTVHDGQYDGVASAASAGRDGTCAQRTGLTGLTVEGGRIQIADDAAVLRGTMHADGLAVLSGTLEGPATMNGRLHAGRFVGELRGWGCTYAVDLARDASPASLLTATTGSVP